MSSTSVIVQLDSYCASHSLCSKKRVLLGMRTLTAGKMHALEGEDIDFLFIFAVLIILS